MEKDFFFGRRWGGREVLVRWQRETEKVIQFEFFGKRDEGRNLERYSQRFGWELELVLEKNHRVREVEDQLLEREGSLIFISDIQRFGGKSRGS